MDLRRLWRHLYLVLLLLKVKWEQKGREKKPEKKKKLGSEYGNKGIWDKQTFFFREKKDILLEPKRDGMAEKR